jgi:hypothetical protein
MGITKPITQQAPFPFGKGVGIGPLVTLRTRQDQFRFVQSFQAILQNAGVYDYNRQYGS